MIDQSSLVMIMSDFSSVSAGIDYTLILKTDGTMWAAGVNSDGQLADSTRIRRSEPVQVYP